MKQIQSVYINGRFSTPDGTEISEIVSPIDGKIIANIRIFAMPGSGY